MVKIAPSILSADFANLGNEIKALEKAGADMIHIDVMDGHFVPNITFGSSMIKSLRRYSKLPFDIHLMINQPQQYIEAYFKAGANMITIHPESAIHLDKTINQIKQYGIKAGVALLPSTSISILEYIIDDIDLILVMTVNPGFGGQKFLTSQLSKIKTISNIIQNKNISLAVDGGINNHTATFCVDAGANILISGDFIFQSSYKKQIQLLRNE